MDGSDAKCKGFCSCVAGEILQRMIRERTQRKLQIGVDDVATPEHYMLKPLCNTGGTAIQIRNMEVQKKQERRGKKNQNINLKRTPISQFVIKYPIFIDNSTIV